MEGIMNNLKFTTAIVVLLYLTPAIMLGQKNDVRDVVGTYKSCLVGCIEIKIRSDFTFSYQPMSDIGEPRIVEGTWKFEESNIIVVNTIEQPNTYSFTKKINLDQKGFIVRILDQKGIPIQYAEVRIPNKNGMLIGETNKHGIAEFPPCAPRAMMVKQPFSKYSNSFALFEFPDDAFNYIEAKITFITMYITNEMWLVQKGKLYFINSYPIDRVK
jgi:hypothetical protein